MSKKRIQFRLHRLSFKIIITILLINLFGCKQKNNKKLIIDNSTNKIEEITIVKSPKTSTKIIFKNGSIESIKFNDSDSGQIVWLSSETRIDQIFNYKDSIKNGHFYSYFPSGALKEHRFLSKGKEILYGADYYDDSISIIKSSLHFNKEGQIFYKKNFDKKGNFISEEGRE